MGRCDVVVAGGTEAPLADLGVAGFANMTALSRSGVSMPFDIHRDGFVIGEGAGVVVLEERRPGDSPRGAHLRRARRCGQHRRCAPHHRSLARRERAPRAAWSSQWPTPGCLLGREHVNSHGTSTPPGDAAEAEAIYKVSVRPGRP